jgi:hypothetical protein
MEMTHILSGHNKIYHLVHRYGQMRQISRFGQFYIFVSAVTKQKRIENQ